MHCEVLFFLISIWLSNHVEHVWVFFIVIDGFRASNGIVQAIVVFKISYNITQLELARNMHLSIASKQLEASLLVQCKDDIQKFISWFSKEYLWITGILVYIKLFIFINDTIASHFRTLDYNWHFVLIFASTSPLKLV